VCCTRQKQAMPKLRQNFVQASILPRLQFLRHLAGVGNVNGSKQQWLRGGMDTPQNAASNPACRPQRGLQGFRRRTRSYQMTKSAPFMTRCGPNTPLVCLSRNLPQCIFRVPACAVRCRSQASG